jgi:hypothetical protein
MNACAERDIDLRTACWHNAIMRIDQVYSVKHGDPNG